MSKKTNVQVNETNTAVVETTQSTLHQVDLSGALHMTTRFASEAWRGAGDETTMPRRLTWLTGNNEAWAINGKFSLPSARGWIIDQPDQEQGLFPDDYEFIDAMELLVERGQAAECLVAHSSENGGKPRRVPSWSLHKASLFVICEGVPSKREMLDDMGCRWGIAYAWPQGRGSELHLVCYIKELLDAGYAGIFSVKFSGTVNDFALKCLHAQNYVLNFAETMRSRAGEETALAYYSYALPVKCSTVTFTAGRQGKSTEIYYPVPDIPRLSMRHPEPAIAYLESVAITDDQAFNLEFNGRVERTVEWSIEKSRRLITGDEAVVTDDALVDDDRPF